MDGQLHKPLKLCLSHKRTLVFHTDMFYAIIHYPASYPLGGWGLNKPMVAFLEETVVESPL